MAGLNSVNGIPSGGQGIGITKERLAAFNGKYGTYTDKTTHPDGMEMFKIASAGPGSVRQMEPRTVSRFEKAIRWVKSLFVKDTTMQETSRTFYEDVSRAFGGAEHIPQNVKAAIGEHCNVEGVEKPLLLSQVRSVQFLASQALNETTKKTAEVRNAVVQQKTEEGESDEVQSHGEKPVKGQNDEERKIKDEEFVNSHLNLTEGKKNEYQQRADSDERVEKEMEKREENMTPEEREKAKNEERENMAYAQQKHDDTKMAQLGVETTLKEDLVENGFTDKKKTFDNKDASKVLYERYKKFGAPDHEKAGTASFFTSHFRNGSGKPGMPLKQDLAKHGIVEHEVTISGFYSDDDIDGALLNETLKARYRKFGDQDQGDHERTESEIAHFTPRFRSERVKLGSVGGGEVNEQKTEEEVQKTEVNEKKTQEKEEKPVPAGVPKPGEKNLAMEKKPTVEKKSFDEKKYFQEVKEISESVKGGLLGGGQSEGGLYVDVHKTLEDIKEGEWAMGDSPTRMDKVCYVLNFLQRSYGASLEGIDHEVPLLGAEAAKEIQTLITRPSGCKVEEFDALLEKLKGSQSEKIIEDTNSVRHAEYRFTIVQLVLKAYLFDFKVEGQ